MAQAEKHVNTDIRVNYDLDLRFQAARLAVAESHSDLFEPAKSEELAATPVITDYWQVDRAVYVLAFDRAGRFLPEASDVRMQTLSREGKVVQQDSLLFQYQANFLGAPAVRSVIEMADQAAHKGYYVHRTVLDSEAPLPEHLTLLSTAELSQSEALETATKI